MTAVALFMLAHSWYPNECCHDMDCRPVPCAELVISGSSAAWRGHNWRTARASPDQACHVCVHNGTVTCVFVPEQLS